MLLDALVHIHDRRIAQSAASTATMQIQVLVAIFFLCPTTSRVSSQSLVLLLLLLPLLRATAAAAAVLWVELAVGTPCQPMDPQAHPERPS